MADDLEQNGSDRVSALHDANGSGPDQELVAFVNYWHGLRQGGDVPLRSAIDPRGIDTLLSNAFIAEKVTPGLARLRIAGTHLSDLLGMEVRGMPLSSLIDPGHRTTLGDAMVDLFERPAQIFLSLRAPGSVRRGALTGSMVILPLRSDLGDVSRAVGCLVTSGTIGVTPRRFEITRCTVRPVDMPGAPRDAADNRTADALTGTRGSGAPATATAPEDETQHKSERPYLRLVRD
ncbi:MAG: PAS domain-containing protein [Pseudomonadota bacterium]